LPAPPSLAAQKGKEVHCTVESSRLGTQGRDECLRPKQAKRVMNTEMTLLC
jgi:hypothetical protein